MDEWTRATTWIQTLTGKRFDFESPTEEMVDIEDIAHALSMLCRYNGHTREFYSVAEHSVHLSRAVEDRDTALALLFHDAAEAYIGDIPRPLKLALGRIVKSMEEDIERVIFEKFNLAWPMPSAVNRLDNLILFDERARLMEPRAEMKEIEGLGVTIQCWTPEQAKLEFLMRYRELTGETEPAKDYSSVSVFVPKRHRSAG